MEIDTSNLTVKLQADQALDFAAFLKGHLAEKLADIFMNYVGVIINMGGDIFARGVDIDKQIFSVSIYNPLQNDDLISVQLDNRALATSGTYRRNWSLADKQFHHIVQGDTLLSADTDILSASVIHESGAKADAFATVAVALGSKKAEDFLRSYHASFILIKKNGEIISNMNF